MAVRKTPMMSAAGVKLVQVEGVGSTGRVMATHYRLSTLRPAQPRVLADRELAVSAFSTEVEASKKDPTAMRLGMAGH